MDGTCNKFLPNDSTENRFIWVMRCAVPSCALDAWHPCRVACFPLGIVAAQAGALGDAASALQGRRMP